ncbi:VWA domain-containing protein [Nostocoides australiense]|nr:VWA domain-containing protein [Tetrasphaera sp.]HPF80199.1 VWA domain-containing protein [Tetrasphaera australiensis]
MAAPPADAPTARLVAFGRALRAHGISTGTSDLVDAAAAAQVLGYDDRERLRAGFASALLRRSSERRLFDDLFDVFFPSALGTRSVVAQDDPLPPAEDAAGRRARAAALRDELATALARRDRRAREEVAARTVAILGRLPNDSTLGAYSAAQALDLLAPQTAIAAALERAQDAGIDVPGGSGDGSGGSGGAGRGLASRFTRDEMRSEIAEFRRAVETETRRRNAEARGSERIARYAVRAPVDQTSFVLAGPDELAELRRAITPLTRKLATRLAARRRSGRGAPIDIRRTLRRAMGTGGVPMRPAYQKRSTSRVDLVLLCDMSSSVAGFSRFTILLMQALASQFRRVRIFGFVNVVDELTETIATAAPGADLSGNFSDTARMTKWHSNSDYGTAFHDFADQHLDAVGHRTVVLILGDARTNNTDPGLDALHTINERAKAVFFLNPEPARQWSSGDSVAHLYSDIVDMHECRNLAQLRHFVARLLPV